MYAKLSDKTIQIAPKQVQWEGQTVINPGEDMLLALGYLPVQYTAQPDVDDGYYAVPRWTKTETEIVQEWDVLKDTRHLSAEEITAMLIKQQINNLTVDDATASRMVEFYPTLKQDGSLVNANSRINWGGKLKRASVDLWDTEANNPDNAPTLWEDIEYRNGVRVIPTAIPATDPFKLGDYGWCGDDLYQSIYDGDNVWTPEGYPAAWTKINL